MHKEIEILRTITESLHNSNSYPYYKREYSANSFRIDEALLKSDRNMRIIKNFFFGETARDIAEFEHLSVGRVCEIIKSELIRSGFIKIISNNKFLSGRSYTVVISKLFDNDLFINDVYTRYNDVLSVVREHAVAGSVSDRRSAILLIMLMAVDSHQQNKTKFVNDVFALYNKGERSVSIIADKLNTQKSAVDYIFMSRHLDSNK